MTSAITGAVVSVVDSSLSSPQEMIVRLKRNMEKMRRGCFTWFPIGGYRRTLRIPEFGGFYKIEGILLGSVGRGSYSLVEKGIFGMIFHPLSVINFNIQGTNEFYRKMGKGIRLEGSRYAFCVVG